MDGHVELPYQVQNPWFSGACHIPTFSNDEMLATKLRAFLQRDKGRDLFDLSYALSNLDPIDPINIVRLFEHYTTPAPISWAQAEQRLFRKFANKAFLLDVRPLARFDRPEAFGEKALRAAFVVVLDKLIAKMHGEPWARTEAMRERFNIGS